MVFPTREDRIKEKIGYLSSYLSKSRNTKDRVSGRTKSEESSFKLKGIEIAQFHLQVSQFKIRVFIMLRFMKFD